MLKHSVTTLIIILVNINNSEYVTMLSPPVLGETAHHIIAVPKNILQYFCNFVNWEVSIVLLHYPFSSKMPEARDKSLFL